MRDVGPDVRRRKNSGAVRKLAETVQGMMDQWTEDEYPHFVETMELIREGAPVQWVKLYLEAVKMGVVRESNITININRQKDRDELQALVRSRISLTDKGTYTPFEEVKSQPLPIPVKKKEEEL